MNDIENSLLEAVARAIYLAMHADKGGRWECVEPRHQESVWGSYARAAIVAMQARSAEPAGEEPVAYRYVHLDYAGRKVSRYGPHPERVNGHDPIEAHPLYAHPATPTNPERLVEALRQADVDFQRTPGTNRDGAIVKHVRESRARIAFALSAAPLKEGSHDI